MKYLCYYVATLCLGVCERSHWVLSDTMNALNFLRGSISLVNNRGWLFLIVHYYDVPKPRRLIEGALIKRYAQLIDSSRLCLPSLVSKMFAAGLISNEVQQSSSFNVIIDEFKAGMSFITTI